ncbi:putative L-Arabinitol 4-dehydrogenase [Piedraia hortae CBS 480.64]|uniref:L-arabinitol 4-dehydrogenase n=1 Tax=Piedraia hortae CBS 480.64 TaxID=1314780 RepID=A0A6A7BYA4_9PEZI|nr:putative L-Arabinitol 4-dehydrogenase [Piedraia hortae CBS 480.64]
MPANLAVYTNPRHELFVDTADDPPNLEPGEVRIAIKSTGICGSDVHFWKDGHIGKDLIEGNHILGHESAGIIVAVHPSVTTPGMGDRVAIEPNIVCGACEPCLTGRYNGCNSVIFPSSPPTAGLLQRFVNHPAIMCHKIGDMSFEEGAMLEPLSVALAGVWRAKISLGDCVLICGAGPIGLVTLACVKAAGATPIVITDVEERRLEFAKTFCPGVRTLLVEPSGDAEAFAQKVSNLTDGLLPSVAMECTGLESSICGAIHAVKFGGRVFVIGVGRDEINFPFMRLSTREIDLQFQYRYAHTWPRAIRLMKDGVVDLKQLITHRFPLDDAAEAFDIAKSGKGIKVMIQNSREGEE